MLKIFVILLVLDIAIVLNCILVKMIEIDNTVGFIKKQFRELLTKQLLKDLENVSELDKQKEQLSSSNN